jgi:hypothetical protein
LLCNGRYIDGYIRAVTRQRLGKRFPEARNEHNNRGAVSSVWSVSRYKQGARLDQVDSVPECVKTGLEPEAKELLLSEPLSGNV